MADLQVARGELAEQAQATESQECLQQRASDIAEGRYRQGVSGFLQGLDAQWQLHTACQNLTQVRRAMWSAAAQFYKTLSGEQS